MKESDYIISAMTAYATLNCDNCQSTVLIVENGNQINFQYLEAFDNCCRYQHLVDDHHNKRHFPISIKERWGMKSWASRVFAFLSAITELYAMLVATSFPHLYHLQQPKCWTSRKLLPRLSSRMIICPLTDLLLSTKDLQE